MKAILIKQFGEPEEMYLGEIVCGSMRSQHDSSSIPGPQSEHKSRGGSPPFCKLL